MSDLPGKLGQLEHFSNFEGSLVVGIVATVHVVAEVLLVDGFLHEGGVLEFHGLVFWQHVEEHFKLHFIKHTIPVNIQLLE